MAATLAVGNHYHVCVHALSIWTRRGTTYTDHYNKRIFKSRREDGRALGMQENEEARARGGAASEVHALSTTDSVSARGETKRRFMVECVHYIFSSANPNLVAGSGRPFTDPTLPSSSARWPRGRVHAASHPRLHTATTPVPNSSQTTNVGSHQGYVGHRS